jgi:hypothetical protein
MHANTLSLVIRSTVFFVLIALSSLAPASPATAQVTAPLPILSSIASAVDPDTIQVRGEGFTAGGEVFIAVLDPWGERSYETRWTTASEPVFDMLGHDDPALGYRPGGLVFESFDQLCGQQVMVRAYDQATGSWSNVVDIVDAC